MVSKMFGQQQSKKSPQQSPNAIKSEFSVLLVGIQSKKKHWSSAGPVSPRSKCKSTGIQSGPEPCWGSSTEVQYREEFSCDIFPRVSDKQHHRDCRSWCSAGHPGFVRRIRGGRPASNAATVTWNTTRTTHRMSGMYRGADFGRPMIPFETGDPGRGIAWGVVGAPARGVSNRWAGLRGNHIWN